MHDLRSDTVTRPTAAMRAAMASAEVGDDVLGEDPTVIRLQQRAATVLGKAAALFVPSGTMGNQICLGVLTRPGDEILADGQAHVLINEAGAPAMLWGCQVREVASRRGVLDPQAVARTVRARGDVHYPRTSVVSLENTHNYAGGAVWPLDALDAVTAVAREHDLAVHMDGARLFNAAVALDVPVARVVRDVDMVSVCLSKGLGAPVGSIVAGDAERMARALRLRKALGGGMRQAGILAAAGLLALDEGPALLAHDHARARRLAEDLCELPGVSVDLDGVQTNIVIVRLQDGAPAVQRGLEDHGILAFALDEQRLRFVFHRYLDGSVVEDPLRACRQVFAAV